MDKLKYSKIPHVLELNRVKRAYTGGKLLDEWQGIASPSDGNFSEEFMISTVEVSNEQKMDREGLSTTILPSGEKITLSELIQQDYEDFLGADYADEKDVRVSARVGDTTVRHVIQCHPDTEFARTELNFPNGKAEAWYIIETREIDGKEPCLYAGFKNGVSKELWTRLFREQNIPGMLNCMHKIPVHKGGVYFVESGMPHCLGPGNMFLEIHEPCDYTFRLEKHYLPNRTFSDYEMDYGLGPDKMLNAFHYETYTEEEILEKCVLTPQLLLDSDCVKAERIVSYEQVKQFMVEKYTFSEAVVLPEWDGHRIAVTLKGNCGFEVNGYEVEAKQGRGVFLPYGTKKVMLNPKGNETEVLICYPPEKKIHPETVFRNPIQVGVLVKDIDSCLKKLNHIFGIGPFRIIDYPPEEGMPFREYHGKNGDFTAKFCFFHLGNIELELIQPISGDNIWDDFIQKHGSGLHHLKFQVSDADKIEKYMNQNGYPVYQKGAAVGANKGLVWSFFPTYEDIGFDVEIMNKHQ